MKLLVCPLVHVKCFEMSLPSPTVVIFGLVLCVTEKITLATTPSP